MAHPFTPPSRIPASLPSPNTPKKEKKESYFMIPPTSDAHLTNAELQQLTRNSLDAIRPVPERGYSCESRTSSRSSASYGRRYGRSGSVSGSIASIPEHTPSSAGLTGLDQMQASHSSSARLHHPQPHTKVSQCLIESEDSSALSISSLDSDPRGRELMNSNDGPSTPAPRSYPVSYPSGPAHHLTGADLHLPPDDIPASVGHLIGADLRLPEEEAQAIPSPSIVPTLEISELAKSASVAALLLEKMKSMPISPVERLPIDDSLAPIPPPLPRRKGSVDGDVSYVDCTTIGETSEMTPPPPSVVALISSLSSQGDSSSDPNWPLPAKTPVYTFIPPPHSGSPIASDMESNIPSDVPSPIGSPFTATQQQPIESFIPPPHTIPSEPLTATASELPASNPLLPLPHIIPTTIAPYTRPFSSTPNSMAPSNQDHQSGFNPVSSVVAPYGEASSSNMPTFSDASEAHSEAAAAASAAYLHPSLSKTNPSSPYNKRSEQDLHLTSPSVASQHQPAAMPTHLASHYRESSADIAAREAYEQQYSSERSSVVAYTHPSVSKTSNSALYNQNPHPDRFLSSPYEASQYQPAAMPSHMASHYRESSAATAARDAYDEPFSFGQASGEPSSPALPAPGALTGAIAGFNRAFNGHNGQRQAQEPVELSAFQTTVVQSPIARVPVPVHGSTPNHLTKPPPAALVDAALGKQPPFHHTSQLNHYPDLHATTAGKPLPGQMPQFQGQAPPIDSQLPAIAPSLHIETVPSFPRGQGEKPSFWRRRKKTLIVLLVIVLLGIGVGIVFVAHSFYNRWGGVGFLGKRSLDGMDAKEWENKEGYLQAANGDVLANQDGADGKKPEKGLLEGMLMGGYKRGWGTDFRNDETDPAPVQLKKVKHITVVPVGSDALLGTPFATDSEIGSDWWTARVTEMHKRGEELLASDHSPEDALGHAAALVQRLADEIRARAEANQLSGTSLGSSHNEKREEVKPPARLFAADGSDKAMLPQEWAVSLASDYVNRIPEDVANNYDVDILMSSMDTSGMKRPAQEVALLAAQGYIARIPEVVTDTKQARSIAVGARGVLTAADIEQFNIGEDVPESVTVTVTETRINTGAPTGLSPMDQAKQFAKDYVESTPHEIEPGSLSAKRRAARLADADALLRRAPQYEAKANAGVYARQAPDRRPRLVDEAAGKPDGDIPPLAPQDAAKAKADVYARQAPDHQPRVNAGFFANAAPHHGALFLDALRGEEDAGRWSDEEDGELEVRKNVPFVTCGDQRQGCEAEGHPEICCPVLHTCHKSPTTNSGVICCPGTDDCSSKDGEVLMQAFCPENTVACPVEAFGGCCETLEQCVSNGCLEFEPGYSPSDDPAKATTETRALTVMPTAAAEGGGEVRTFTEQVGGDVRVTATVAKEGEVASGTASAGSAETSMEQTPKKSEGRKWRWSGLGGMCGMLGGVAVVMAGL